MKEPVAIAERIAHALSKLRELAARSKATSDLVVSWAPTVAVVQRLGFTLFRVANQLVAAASDDDTELMPDALAAELRGDLQELANTFPGVDRVIFGTETVDELIDAAVADEGVNSAFVAVGRSLGRRFDTLIDQLVAIAIDPASVGFSQQQLVAYLGGVERIFDKILDRWLADATGTS